MKNDIAHDASPFSFEEVVPEPEVKWRETLRVFCQNRMEKHHVRCHFSSGN
jgi:hypothetical protein